MPLGTSRPCCYNNQYQPTYHGDKQRYVSPTTGRCKPLIVQAVHPKEWGLDRIEVSIGNNVPLLLRLAGWLSHHPPVNPLWLLIWIVGWPLYQLALLWALVPPYREPKHTGLYPAYLSRYYGQLWIARSPREYALRRARLGAEPVHEITHSTHPRRLVIYNPDLGSWHVCSDSNIIKQQRYIAVSYRYEDIVPEGRRNEAEDLKANFITEVEAVMTSLHQTAYWIDLMLVDRRRGQSREEVDKDLYRMADVYRGAEFTLIMLCPPDGVEETDAWFAYGQRLWTFPEALLSRRLRFKFRGGEVTPITLHQLANRAYAGFPEESAIINAYGLKDPLERLERLSLLRSALWRRTSTTLEELRRPDAEQVFRAERVYALMGFFEHRIHPHHQETELQALVRLSIANDNDRIVERMVSLLPFQIPDTACWYAEEDGWGANLWDIEPEAQVVGMTEREAIVLGGCRAAAIRWKNFPHVAFAVRRSYKRRAITTIPYFSWPILAIAVFLWFFFGFIPGVVGFAIAGFLMLVAPLLTAYGHSGRIVHAQPWLIGVKGLISAKDASKYMYGSAIFAIPRTSYTTAGTLLSKAETGQFRRGDEDQLRAIQWPQNRSVQDNDNLYTLIDTLSATIYYFRAARPPTVCLYTGRESGMGRFVLCSERCKFNELHKETVVRMPWYISQSMRACDWVALG